MVNINLSNHSAVPMYEQIVDQIKGQILSGRLAQGELLPSIRVLARELQVSIITTKRAYEELEAQGFLSTVAGKGTFVAVQNPQRLMEMHLQKIEGYLQQAVDAAQAAQIPKEQLLEMIALLYEEESI